MQLVMQAMWIAESYGKLFAFWGIKIHMGSDYEDWI